jgi:LysM repeat protein
MRLRWYLILMAVSVNLILGGALMLSLATTAGAQTNCPAIHVVKPGEWLALIARQYDTSVDVLIQLNPRGGRNPNLIFPGEELCVPAPNEPSSVAGEPSGVAIEHSNVAIETMYQYRPEQDDTIFQLHTTTWKFGTRRVFPLQAIDGVEFVTDTQRLSDILSEQPAPVLVALSNEVAPDPPRTYSLFEVGDTEHLKILPSLQVSTTRAITLTLPCLASPALDTLEVGQVDAVTTTLWLEEAGGMRMPFAVTGFGVVPAEHLDCLNDPDMLALFLIPSASEPNTYRLKARLSETGIGPEGARIRWNLSYGYRGWGYRFLRSFFGRGR